MSALKKKLFCEWCRMNNCADLADDAKIHKDIKEIVDFADTIDAWMHCKEEVDNGNTAMQEIYMRQKAVLVQTVREYKWAQQFYQDYLLDML